MSDHEEDYSDEEEGGSQNHVSQHSQSSPVGGGALSLGIPAGERESGVEDEMERAEYEMMGQNVAILFHLPAGASTTESQSVVE